jgi:hypothetical protein
MLGSRKYDTQTKVYAAIGGSNWKSKVTKENALQMIDILKTHGMKDRQGNPVDPMVLDKIKRVQEYYDFVCEDPNAEMKIWCHDCNAVLHAEARCLVNFADYELQIKAKKKCPTPKQCK